MVVCVECDAPKQHFVCLWDVVERISAADSCFDTFTVLENAFIAADPLALKSLYCRLGCIGARYFDEGCYEIFFSGFCKEVIPVIIVHVRRLER